jgi:hypothetical protein
MCAGISQRFKIFIKNLVILRKTHCIHVTPKTHCIHVTPKTHCIHVTPKNLAILRKTHCIHVTPKTHCIHVTPKTLAILRKTHCIHVTPKLTSFAQSLSSFSWLPFPTSHYRPNKISHAFLAFPVLAICPVSRSLLGFNILAEINDCINHVGPWYVKS